MGPKIPLHYDAKKTPRFSSFVPCSENDRLIFAEDSPRIMENNLENRVMAIGFALYQSYEENSDIRRIHQKAAILFPLIPHKKQKDRYISEQLDLLQEFYRKNELEVDKKNGLGVNEMKKNAVKKPFVNIQLEDYINWFKITPTSIGLEITPP